MSIAWPHPLRTQSGSGQREGYQESREWELSGRIQDALGRSRWFGHPLRLGRLQFTVKPHSSGTRRVPILLCLMSSSHAVTVSPGVPGCKAVGPDRACREVFSSDTGSPVKCTEADSPSSLRELSAFPLTPAVVHDGMCQARLTSGRNVDVSPCWLAESPRPHRQCPPPPPPPPGSPALCWFRSGRCWA